MQRTDPPPSVSIVGIGATTIAIHASRQVVRVPPVRTRHARRDSASTRPVRRAQFEHIAGESGHLQDSMVDDAPARRREASTGPALPLAIASRAHDGQQREPTASITLV